MFANSSKMTSYLHNLNDEDYLVLRAKQAQTKDSSDAKAWLITARSLFPKNCKIQFEAYSMHKHGGNVLEAAHNFELMFRNFKNEDSLWLEVQNIIESLRSDVLDSNLKFLRELYSKLNVDVQRGLLLTAAEKTEDIIEHCKMLIMLLQKFPECSSQHGMMLVENLITAEKHTYPNSPVNSLRKLLIADILPLVLKSPSVEISQNHLYRLLHKSIEFCVYSIMKPYGLEDTKANGPPGNQAVSDALWNELIVILELTGQKLGWDLQDIFKTNDWEAQWQRLKTINPLRVGALDNPSSFVFQQVLYCATILFLRGFCEYVSIVDPNHLEGPVDERGCSAALVEGLRTHSKTMDGKPKYKKAKFDAEGRDESMADLAVSGQLGQSSGNLVRSFLIAVRCWDLLHDSEALATEFSQLSQQLLIDSWPCFQSFQIDVLLYKGLFNEAVQWLSSIPIPNAPGYMEKFLLQAACCYHQLGDYTTACGKAMDVVCAMSEKSPSTANLVGNVAILSKPVRNLIFLSLTMADVLHFCIKLLTSRLKEIALSPSFSNDTALGHLLVLLQYDWPQEENLFLDIIEHIKQRGTFSYNIFFNYVINVDMLEEFAHLSLPVGGSLTFNLLPSTVAQNSKQRAVTRGVNKGAKEDFRAAIEKQVSRCGENILPLLVQFLMTERETLFENVQHV